LKKLVSVLLTLAVVLGLSLAMVVPVAANSVSSSTMIFQGNLTYDSATGAFTGTIDMVNETAKDLGDKIAGFDVYAKWGATAYVEGMTPDNWTIGSDHDAYSKEGPWGSWFDPDCADWNKYSLELTEDHWYLRYTPTNESPMSGTMDWKARYAAETDNGTDHDASNMTDPTQYGAGSAQEWGCNWGWGAERVPLQFPGFDVTVTGSAPLYTVTLTPAKATTTLLTADVPDIVAISVLPTSIDFGTLKPGETSAIFNIDVENIGTRTVNVDVDVYEAGLFYENLEMTNNGNPPWSKRPWNKLVAGLAMDAVDDVQTQLKVPGTYTGSESATLVFTAEAA